MCYDELPMKKTPKARKRRHLHSLIRTPFIKNRPKPISPRTGYELKISCHCVFQMAATYMRAAAANEVARYIMKGEAVFESNTEFAGCCFLDGI